MKTIAVMQPYFMPYIGYFQLIKAVNVFVIYDDVNYINKGWINRNNLLGNNEATPFVLTLSKASQNKRINEIDLFELNKFKKKFFKMVETSYRKSPYYNSVLELLQSIFEYEEINLSRFITNSIKKTIEYLEIQTQIIETSTVYQNGGLKAEERILDICIKEGALRYINPIGGIQLYSMEKFANNGIELNFIKTDVITYNQGRNDFVPYLSIIDVMMFNSKNEIKKILEQYTLIKN